MTKTFLCDMCRFADIQIKEYYVPLFANSLDIKKVKRMVIWCKKQSRYRKKLSTKTNCGYRPRAGKIGNHIEQKVLL